MGTLVADNHLEIFRGKRVLVTGHTGFKGSWLTLLLNGLGAEVMGYALAPEYAVGHFERLGLEKQIRHVTGDVRTVLDVANAIASQFENGSVVVDEPRDKPHEARLLQLNSDKARQLLQWDTRWNFEQTLAATGGWYREVLVQGKSAEVVSRAQISAYYGGQL